MKRCAVPCLGLVVLLLPAMAIAQVDPAPDGIGLYWNVPVAVINGAAPVPVVAGTWGAVKSLYGRQGPGQA